MPVARVRAPTRRLTVIEAPSGRSIDDRLRAAGLPPLPRPAWLEIDEDALESNLRTIRGLAPGRAVAAVIKADGYGHGLEVTARAFRRAGAELLCVATLDEAFALRRAGIDAPVLVLFPVPTDATPDAAAAAIEIVVSGPADGRPLIDRWSRIASPTPLRVHLEIDTGLRRGGVEPEATGEMARSIAAIPSLVLAGIWTHLATPADAAFTAAQVRRFEAAVEAARAVDLPAPVRHVAATGGLLTGTGPPFEMVRPGLCLYGEVPFGLPIGPGIEDAAAALRPAMSVKARPIRIASIPAGTPVGYGGLWTAAQPSVVATLPVGYGDGYLRGYQPGAEALVRGRRVPIVGAIAMDAMHVDVTGVASVSPDDEFVLLGAQGDDRITVTELARRRTTIAWEVLTSMARRMPRVYHAAAGTTGVRTLAGEFRPRQDTYLTERGPG